MPTLSCLHNILKHNWLTHPGGTPRHHPLFRCARAKNGAAVDGISDQAHIHSANFTHVFFNRINLFYLSYFSFDTLSQRPFQLILSQHFDGEYQRPMLKDQRFNLLKLKYIFTQPICRTCDRSPLPCWRAEHMGLTCALFFSLRLNLLCSK